MLVDGKAFRTVWMEGMTVCMIDQIRLPHFFEIYRSPDYQTTARAIQTMIVRGAGALAGAGAYGMVQVFQTSVDDNAIWAGYQLMRSTRPTAQNLFYAVDRVYQAGMQGDDIGHRSQLALEEASRLCDEDSQLAAQIGANGNTLIADDARILTHCNAGWLAFVDWGTALAPIYRAHQEGKKVFVYVDETRPLLQGARLTAWELAGYGIPHTIIPDNAAAYYMAKKQIDLVITGADRIAANGDTANKIGTLDRAILATYFGIPFYIAAPTTTIDFNTPNGANIPIEERSPNEVHYASGILDDGQFSRVRLSPSVSPANNPAFDVTPHELITKYITEKGIHSAGELAQLK